MKLRFEKKQIRDTEEQGEKADPVQVHHGMTPNRSPEQNIFRAGSLGNHTLSSGHPGMLLARISIFETVASDKMQAEKATVIRYRSTVLRQEHGPVLGRAVLYS